MSRRRATLGDATLRDGELVKKEVRNPIQVVLLKRRFTTSDDLSESD